MKMHVILQDVIDGLFANGIMGVEMPMDWGGAEVRTRLGSCEHASLCSD